MFWLSCQLFSLSAINQSHRCQEKSFFSGRHGEVPEGINNSWSGQAISYDNAGSVKFIKCQTKHICGMSQISHYYPFSPFLIFCPGL